MRKQQRVSGPYGGTPTGRRPLRTVMPVEALEGRALLSAFTVLNLADGGDGSLRQAILDANTEPGADTIHFADSLNGSIALTGGQLSITDHLTIDGPGAEQLAVSGNHQSRVFRISGGAMVAIAGLTISDGRALGAPGPGGGDGGGILNIGSYLSLERVVLSNNQAVSTPGTLARGGAIANLSGTLTATDCLFTQNRALGGANGGPAQGGGITNVGGSTTTLTASTFVGNEAIAGDGSANNAFGRGGGIYSNSSTLRVENCTFMHSVARGGSNSTRRGTLIAPAGGAGIFNGDRAVLFVTGSTFTGNQALGGSNNTSTGADGDVGTAFGGGLNNVGTATISDSLFEDNEARGGSDNRGDGTSFQFVGTALGGAISTTARNPAGDPVSLALSNVTLRHNRAVGGDGNSAGTFVDAGFGGGLGIMGINSFGPLSAGCLATVEDSTVAHNRAVGGRGGAALGGGISNLLGGVVAVSGGTLTHNRAQGGDGGTGADGGSGFGGGIYNGFASSHRSNPGAPTVLTVDAGAITHNKAEGGGAGTIGSRGGDGSGGGLWNGGTAGVRGSVLTRNMALGADGEGGATGGDGLGGGAYNAATARLRLERSSVISNHANGGHGGGQGIGGGVYNRGLFDADQFSVIDRNHASTSNGDTFGLD